MTRSQSRFQIKITDEALTLADPIHFVSVTPLLTALCATCAALFAAFRASHTSLLTPFRASHASLLTPLRAGGLRLSS